MIQKKILVIDDEADIRHSIQRILMKQGYMVQTAASIRDAVSMLVDTKYDLITCDIMIPQAGGFELIDEIKSDDAYANVPLIMITAMDKHVLDTTKHRADVVLPKPFKSKELVAQVKELLSDK